MERYPNFMAKVGGSISSCEISSLLDRVLAMWSIASYALALACQSYVSKGEKNIGQVIIN